MLITILLAGCLAGRAVAQEAGVLTASTVHDLAMTYDSLLSLGDPVGLDDLLAPEFSREIVVEGKSDAVKQSRQAFLASITESLSETDIILTHKRSPFSIRFNAAGDEAEVEYTVTDHARTAEGTEYIATIGTLLRAGLRDGQPRILSIRNETRYKNRE